MDRRAVVADVSVRGIPAGAEWHARVAQTRVGAGGRRANAWHEELKALGERTCALVYGSMYDRLRRNIRDLHPALDDWMIVEGYGKVLSRPGLDLGRRELCIVAACAASAQDRQLQSHLHGARNVGVPEPVVTAALESLRAVIPEELHSRAIRLWDRIRNDVH